MVATAKAKVSLDTASVSAGLSRVSNKSKEAVGELAKGVPILGQINSSATAIALGFGSVLKIATAWVDKIKEASELLKTANANALSAAANAGFAGRGGELKRAVDSVSTQGTATREQLIGGFNAFMGAAPAATYTQAQAGLQYSQKAMTGGMSGDLVNDIAGSLVQNVPQFQKPGMIGLAYDYATYLAGQLGNDAKEASQLIPYIMSLGASFDEAISIVVSIRGQGPKLRGEMLSQLKQTGSVGGMKSLLSRKGFTVAPVENQQGYLDKFYEQQVWSDSDTLNLTEAGIAANEAIIDKERTRANSKYVRDRAYLARDDATRIGSDNPVFTTARDFQAMQMQSEFTGGNSRSFGPMPSLDQTYSVIMDRVLKAQRTLKPEGE
jgi:hypothetical protein